MRGKRAAIGVLTSVLASSASAASQEQGAVDQNARRTVTAVRLAADEKIVLDGHLEESVWSRAIPATDFVQQQPKNGAPATESTEVRFAFNREALYMGVICFDKEPDKMLGNTMKRDEFLTSDDRFMWVIDPFLDAQSGYFFEMNPSGLMGDSLMMATGPVNREWDGIWNARARRSEIGWTLEIEIPFRTVNFNPDGQAWGINFNRSVRRKGEDSLWSGWGYNQGLFRMQNTGLLLGISDVSQGHGLDIRPYGLTTATASPGRGTPGTQWDADAGLDLYYSVTPKLRANVTVNTDFAQTEVDQRLVNLTQFPLFFPEKRGFFLEGINFFNFASSNIGQFGFLLPSTDTAVVPFFSRRIGLDATGSRQPIDAGGRLTGQVGAQDIGVLYIRSGEEDSNPGEDFTVLRMRRRMFRQSYIGTIFTRRNARASEADSLSTFGLDYRFGTNTFRGTQNLETSGYFLQTTNPLDTGRNHAFGLSVDYPNDRYLAGVAYREVQENYNAAVGFTLRTGYRRYYPYFQFRPRPRNSRWVRQYTVGASVDLQRDTKANQLLLRQWDFTLFQVMLNSEDTIQVHFLPTFERLDRDFGISTGITLPNGTQYNYSRFRAQLSTANRRVIAVALTAEAGDFYSGDRRHLSVGLAIRPRPGITAKIDGDWNSVSLVQGAFITRLYRAVLDTQLNPWVALTNTIQFDSVSAVLGWQSRFRWILRPGNDLYVVYNHNWLDDPTFNRFSTVDRRAASKILYTLQF